MVPHAGPESRVFRDVVQLGQDLKALAEIKGSSKKQAPVAILWDWESWHGSEMDGHPSSLLDYFREAREWWVALLNLGIRVDVIPAHANLKYYQLVIAPILYLVRDSVKEAVESFVKTGGHFVTTYQSGIVDVNDHVLLGGYPGAFRELLGIRVEEWAPLLKNESIQLDDGSTGTVWSEEVDVVGDDVDILRTYTEGDLKGQAAVTRRSHGNGSAAYISTRLGVDGLQKLLPDLLSKAGVSSSLATSLQDKVEQVIRKARHGKTEWEFLINRTAEEVDLQGVVGELVVASGDAGIGKLAPRGIAVFRKSF
jgi:beta-galactosidase